MFGKKTIQKFIFVFVVYVVYVLCIWVLPFLLTKDCDTVLAFAASAHIFVPGLVIVTGLIVEIQSKIWEK